MQKTLVLGKAFAWLLLAGVSVAGLPIALMTGDMPFWNILGFFVGVFMFGRTLRKY